MLEEGVCLIVLLGNYFVMLLCNYGMLIIGWIVVEVYVLMVMFIKVCEIQIQVLVGGEVVLFVLEVVDCVVEQFEDGGVIEGVIEWLVFLCKLDKIDVLYCD